MYERGKRQARTPLLAAAGGQPHTGRGRERERGQEQGQQQEREQEQGREREQGQEREREQEQGQRQRQGRERVSGGRRRGAGGALPCRGHLPGEARTPAAPHRQRSRPRYLHRGSSAGSAAVERTSPLVSQKQIKPAQRPAVCTYACPARRRRRRQRRGGDGLFGATRGSARVSGGGTGAVTAATATAP